MDYSFIDEIPQNIFKDIEEIGSGAYSDIFSAVYQNTNSKVALKVSLKSNKEEDLKTFKQEINANKSLHHPFICKYFTDIETDHLNIIVMELIEGTSALNYVNKMHGLPPQDALNIFTELLIAIEYLHNEAHITHRDLKLENIMIDKYNHIRLIDFGFSSDNSMMTTCCGSIPYCAPEILSGQRYTKAADIWSLGVIFYAMIEGNLPFYHPNMNSLAFLICQKEVEFSPNFSDLQIQDLIRKMLIKNPEHRITIDEIKKHPAISHQKLLQINYKKLFQSDYENSLNLSFQKLNDNSNILSKSFTGIQFGNCSQNCPLLKESSFSGDANYSYDNLKMNNKHEYNNELDESIKKRENLSMNLNKMIETALLNHFPQKRILLHVAISNNINSRLNCHRVNCKKRNNPYIFKNVSPIRQPNVVNNQKISEVKKNIVF